MDKEAFRQELLAVFAGELETHIETLHGNLRALQGASHISLDDERVQKLHRAAHTLKGAAQAVGLREVQRMGQSMERLLSSVMTGRRVMEQELQEILSTATARLDGVQAQLTQRGELDSTQLEDVLLELEAIAEENGP